MRQCKGEARGEDKEPLKEVKAEDPGEGSESEYTEEEDFLRRSSPRTQVLRQFQRRARSGLKGLLSLAGVGARGQGRGGQLTHVVQTLPRPECRSYHLLIDEFTEKTVRKGTILEVTETRGDVPGQENIGVTRTSRRRKGSARDTELGHAIKGCTVLRRNPLGVFTTKSQATSGIGGLPITDSCNGAQKERCEKGGRLVHSGPRCRGRQRGENGRHSMGNPCMSPKQHSRGMHLGKFSDHPSRRMGGHPRYGEGCFDGWNPGERRGLGSRVRCCLQGSDGCYGFDNKLHPLVPGRSLPTCFRRRCGPSFYQGKVMDPCQLPGRLFESSREGYSQESQGQRQEGAKQSSPARQARAWRWKTSCSGTQDSAPQTQESRGGQAWGYRIGSEEADDEAPAPVSGPARVALRDRLRETRERILTGGDGALPRQAEGAASGGAQRDPRELARGESRLVAGTALNPGLPTPLALTQSAGTKEGAEKSLMKRLAKRSDAASCLLAQAVQTNQQASRNRKDKKDKKQGDGLKALVDLLKGKKKKKRRKRKRHRDSDAQTSQGGQGPLKPDPDGSDSSGSGGSSGSSSSSSGRRKRSLSSSDSELSFEPPLRRRAAKEPGSVMAMLVKHAQEQLDKGSLLEAEGAAAGITSGVKISTFFALLIRPFYPATNALMRELYALGQTIDLLRAGKLPEAADAPRKSVYRSPYCVGRGRLGHSSSIGDVSA